MEFLDLFLQMPKSEFVVWLFLTMSQVCLQFVIVVFPDRTHLLFEVEEIKIVAIK